VIKLEIVLNDLAFKYKVNSIYEIKKIIENFVNVLIELQKAKVKFRIIFEGDISNIELMNGYMMPKIYNEKSISKDKKLIILRTFSKIKKIQCNDNEVFCFDDNESRLCNWAIENKIMIASIITNDILNNSVLKGRLKKNNEYAELYNICEPMHIRIFAEKLGIRVYELNPKHKLGFNWGSPMDLNDEEAQEVLDSAIIYNDDDKCLINFYKGNYYVFRRHINNCYHGYIDARVPENIKMKLKDVVNEI